jgi:hypothetical protein
MISNYLRGTILLCACLGVAVCKGQQSVGRPTVAVLLRTLSSDQWMERARAYEQLRSDQAALRGTKVRTALLDLLDRENRVVESTLRESQEQVGTSGKYGEEYGEYLGELSQSVDAFADWNNPHQVCIFVKEPYDPDSRFAAKIAAHAKVSAPCLVEMYGNDLGVVRGKAVSVLVQALASPKQDLDAGTVRQVREIVRTALHDNHESVRSATVAALGRFGEQDMLPALKEVADTDPAPEVQGHSVREQAVKAIAAIEKRVAQNQR